jgi:glutamate--cysteine ligase
MKGFIEKEIEKNFNCIQTWLNTEKAKGTPLFYTSVDLRESDYKFASIDTNIFPAGFNNLSPSNRPLMRASIKNYLSNHYPNTTHILLFSEDHTRNPFYLENVRQLSQCIESSGIKCTIGTFFNDHPAICNATGHLKLSTSSNHDITVYCLDYIIRHMDEFNVDLCLLNNDLSDGNYGNLSKLNIPIIPHPNLGWHKRKKSNHINTLNDLTKKMIMDCKLPIDPWLLSSCMVQMSSIDINCENDRQRLADAAQELLNKIQKKYKENTIPDTPYLVLKSDNGTYGMGVISINSPDDIRTLNRKNRNKLHKGKSSIKIQNLIIQEGVPSSKKVNNQTSEEVIYHLNGDTIGGFYRVHEKKSNKDILNSKGMTFKAFEDEINDHLNHPPMLKSMSKTSYVLGQLANLSAQHEFNTL